MFVVFHSCSHTHWPLLECSSVALTHIGFFSSVLRLSTDVFGPYRMFFRFSDMRFCFCSVLQLSARALVPSVVFYSCPHAHWSFRNVLHVSACAVASTVVFYICPHSHWSFLECSSVTGTCVVPSVVFYSSDTHWSILVFYISSNNALTPLSANFTQTVYEKSGPALSGMYCVSVKSELRCLISY
jgi:hypothetical protein